MNENSVQIGKYTISKDPNNDEGMVWISAEDGEGGQFSIAQLEPIIAQFYNENF